MKIETENMSSNEIVKIGNLISFAGAIGMDVSGYGEAAVNKTSGNVYLWLEDYNFCLYIPTCGDQSVQACYSCPHDGEETIIDATSMSLEQIEQWAYDLCDLSQAKEGAA